MITVINIDVLTRELIEKAYITTLDCLSMPREFEVTVSFVGISRIHKLNKVYRGMDCPTDVLTFPNIVLTLPFEADKYQRDINPETNKLFLGDVIISHTVAKRQAEEYGHSLTREILFLSIHGILHLLGFDHLNKQEEDIMIKHQEAILERLGVVR